MRDKIIIEIMKIDFQRTAIGMEVAGMVAENDQRKINNESLAYREQSFQEKRDKVNDLINKLDTIKKIIT